MKRNRNPLAGFRTCSPTISHYHCTIAGTLRFNELHNLKLKHCCRWLVTCSQLFMSWVFHREKRQPYGNWHGARAVTTWGFPPCSLLMLSIAVVMHFYCFPTHLPIKWGERIFQMGGGGGKASEEGKVSGVGVRPPPVAFPFNLSAQCLRGYLSWQWVHF